MNEVIRATEDTATNRGDVQYPQDQETIMGGAFKELAQKLKGGEVVVDTNSVGEILKDMGIVGESKTADIMPFPFKKTEEGQEELGKEIGLMVKEIIENHSPNITPVSENGDTISHMTPEKPPAIGEKRPELTQAPPKKESREVLENSLSMLRQQLKDLEENMGKGSFSPKEEGGKEGDEVFVKSLKKQINDLEGELGEKTLNNNISHIVYGSPNERGSSENMPPVSYKDIVGATIPTREGVWTKQEANVSPQETPVLNTNIIEELATEKQLPQKELVRIELERSTLIKELRENSTLTAEKQTALDRLTGQMKILRGEISSTPKETGATPSINEVVHADLVTREGSQITPEAAAILQIVDEGGLPAFNHLDIERICKENGIELSLNHTPVDIVNKLKAKRSGVSLESKEKKPQEMVEQVATESDKNIENITSQKTEGLDRQLHTEDFPRVSAFEQVKKEISDLKQKREEILKNIRDHTTITDYVEEGNKVNRKIEGLENTLRNPVKLNQQEINDTQDVETPNIEAHMNAGIDTMTPDSTTHVKATGEIVPNPFEKAITKIKSEDPERAERLLKTIGASPEQKERIEKLLGATETQAQKVEQEMKERDHWIVERALKIGEGYRKIQFRKKFIASLILVGGASALAASGGAGAAMIATAALTGSGFQRLLGSLAMFATVEGALTKRSIARNEKEEKIMGMRTNVVLGALAASGVFFGGKLLGDYLSTHAGSGASVDHIKVPPPVSENTPSMSTPEVPASPLHGAIENSAQNEYAQKVAAVRDVLKNEAAQTVPLAEATYTVHGGDNLWNIIKEKILGIQDLDGEGRQSNAIANIIEQIKKDPESFGITSGNVDGLSAGDTLHLDKIHDILKTTSIPIEDGQSVGIIERASGLTDTEASHIINNNAKISAWHTTHPDTLLTTETVDKVLRGTMDSGTQTNHLAEITKDYTLSMPDTGGRTIEQLSAEALSLDTDAILHADVQYMFGSKGFFGYGFLGTNGERSVDWLNLKDHSVSEVISKKFVGVSMGEEGGVQKFGIDSYSAVDKMKGYIKMLIEKTGGKISPESNESVEHFSKRAIGVIISKK